jgi:hypothetical protein
VAWYREYAKLRRNPKRGLSDWVPSPNRREGERSWRCYAAKTNSDGTLNRLYERVEQGLASPSDRDFAGRLTHHRQRIAALTADIVSLERNWPPASAALRLT